MSPTLVGLQTALQDACVCLYVCLSVCLWPYAVNFKCAFKYMKIEVQHQLPGAKMVQVEVCTATYCLFVMAAMDRPSTEGCLQTVQIIHAGLRLLQVRGMHKRHS